MTEFYKEIAIKGGAATGDSYPCATNLHQRWQIVGKKGAEMSDFQLSGNACQQVHPSRRHPVTGFSEGEEV